MSLSKSLGLIGFDVLWLYFNYGSWISKISQNKVPLFMSFLFVGGNAIIKIILSYTLLLRNQKIIKQKQNEIDKILSNNIR